MKNKKNICLKIISVLCGLLICFSSVLGLFTGVEKVMFPLTQSAKAEETMPAVALATPVSSMMAMRLAL